MSSSDSSDNEFYHHKRGTGKKRRLGDNYRDPSAPNYFNDTAALMDEFEALDTTKAINFDTHTGNAINKIEANVDTLHVNSLGDYLPNNPSSPPIDNANAVGQQTAKDKQAAEGNTSSSKKFHPIVTNISSSDDSSSDDSFSDDSSSDDSFSDDSSSDETSIKSTWSSLSNDACSVEEAANSDKTVISPINNDGENETETLFHSETGDSIIKNEPKTLSMNGESVTNTKQIASSTHGTEQTPATSSNEASDEEDYDQSTFDYKLTLKSREIGKWKKPDYGDKDWIRKNMVFCQRCRNTYSTFPVAFECYHSHCTGNLLCLVCFTQMYGGKRATRGLYQHYLARHEKGATKNSITCPYCSESLFYKDVSCHMMTFHFKKIESEDIK